MSDVFGSFPQLPGTPIEKLKAERNYERIEQHIRSMLSQNPSKEEVLRAFRYYDEQTRIYNDRYSRILEQWANSHRHRGLIGEDGEFWTPEPGGDPGGDPFVLGSYIAMASSPIAVVGTESTVLDPTGIVGTRNSVSWSPDGSLIAVATTSSPYLFVVDVVTGELDTGWPSMSGNGNTVAFSPDGTKLLFCHNGSPGYRVIDVELKEIETGWPSMGTACQGGSWDAAGQRIVVTRGTSPRLIVIDVNTKTVEGGWEDPNGSTSLVRPQFSPDSSKLCVFGAGAVNQPAILDVATRSIESGWPALDSPAAVAWSPDGAFLALGQSGSGLYERLVIVDTATKGVVTSGWPSGNTSGAMQAVAWHPNGSRLAYGGSNNSLLVWNVEEESIESGWPSPSSCRSVAFANSTGNMIAN